MNHRLIFLFSILLFLGLSACDQTANSNSTDVDQPTDQPSTESTTKEKQPTAIPKKNDCHPDAKVLADNNLWLRHQQKLIRIEADSSTLDKNLGDSYRILNVYDTKECQSIFKQTLPVNNSPDFPYYIAKINYNKNSNLVAIRGFEEVYCFDVNNNQLLTKMTPSFQSKRNAVDAQSGMIQQLELWENYLIGYCQDYGAFVFDLQNSNASKSIKPIAEFKEGDQYHSLFLLKSGADHFQAIIPNFDQKEGKFSINPLLDKPKKISTSINQKATNNRYLIINENIGSDNNAIAIDMKQRKNIVLPKELENKKTQEILKWLQSQK